MSKSKVVCPECGSSDNLVQCNVQPPDKWVGKKLVGQPVYQAHQCSACNVMIKSPH